MFDFDPITYVCLGGEGTKYDCKFGDWVDNSLNTTYVELENVMEMRRQTTDFFDSKNLAKGQPKVYTWDTPDKDSVNNYQMIDSGLVSIGFRFNLNQQTRAIVKFKNINDVVSSIGGFKASVASIFTILYVTVCGKLVKFGMVKKIGQNLKNHSMGDKDIDEVRDRLGVSSIGSGKLDAKSIMQSLESHGDPEKVFQ